MGYFFTRSYSPVGVGAGTWRLGYDRRSLIHFDPAIVCGGDGPGGWARRVDKPQPHIATHEAHGGVAGSLPVMPLHGGVVPGSLVRAEKVFNGAGCLVADE